MTHRPSPHERVLLIALPVLAAILEPTLGNPFAPKQMAAPIVAWAAVALLAARGAGVEARWVVPAAAFAVAGGVSILSARNLGAAVWGWSIGAGFTLMFALAAGAGTTRAFRRGLPLAFAGTGALVSAFALIQAAGAPGADLGLQALGKMRAFSTLGNPNFVAFLLLPAIPAAAIGARTARTRGGRALAIAAASVMVAGLAVTQARSAFVAAGLGFIAWLAVARRSRWLVAAIAAASLAGAVAVGALSHSGRGRLLVWREAIAVWASAPLTGVGLGNFNVHQLEAQRAVFRSGGGWDRFAQNASFVLDAHCEPLHLLAEAGPLAAAAFVALAAGVLRRGARRARRSPVHRLWYAALAAQLAFCLFNAPLFFGPLALSFWLSALPLAARLRPRRAHARPPLALALVPAAVALACAAVAPRLYRAAALEGEAALPLEAGPASSAVQLLGEAARLNPWDGYVREKLALALTFDGQHDRAVAELRRARQLFGDVGIEYLTAELLARQGRHAEAAAAFEDIAAAFPQHVTPPFMLGQLYLRLGRYRDAERAFSRAAAMPDSPHNLKLDRAKVRRQKELARAFLEQAPELQAFREGP
jgi:tetratricopeptide (TPR) repeat protein